MPRAGPPTFQYSLPAGYLAIPGTTILAAQHNVPLEDIASTLNGTQPVVLGGTGATNETNARANLGLTIGTDVQAYRQFLTLVGVKGADIASATTTDLLTATGDWVDVTGTTTITGLGTVPVGEWRLVRFTGILTLTYNVTSLILPTAASITTAAGDFAMFRSLGSGNWTCASYQRASGAPLVGATNGLTNNTADQTMTGGINTTPLDLGTISSGTTTLNWGDRSFQYYTNNGAHTLAPDATSGSAGYVDITNGASAGAVTLSGWTKVVGAMATTNGLKYRLHGSTNQGGSLLMIQALQ